MPKENMSKEKMPQRKFAATTGCKKNNMPQRKCWKRCHKEKMTKWKDDINKRWDATTNMPQRTISTMLKMSTMSTIPTISAMLTMSTMSTNVNKCQQCQ